MQLIAHPNRISTGLKESTAVTDKPTIKKTRPLGLKGDSG